MLFGGKFVRKCARTTPEFPCGRVMRPQMTRTVVVLFVRPLHAPTHRVSYTGRPRGPAPHARRPHARTCFAACNRSAVVHGTCTQHACPSRRPCPCALALLQCAPATCSDTACVGRVCNQAQRPSRIHCAHARSQRPGGRRCACGPCRWRRNGCATDGGADAARDAYRLALCVRRAGRFLFCCAAALAAAAAGAAAADAGGAMAAAACRPAMACACASVCASVCVRVCRPVRACSLAARAGHARISLRRRPVSSQTAVGMV